MNKCDDTIKNREIRFNSSRMDQAAAAESLLQDISGIESSTAITPRCLQVRYNIENLTLKQIESALRKVGFDLDDGLIIKLKRAVFSYCEDALRASRGVFDLKDHRTPQLAMSRLPLKDPRRYSWRRYI